MSNLVEHARRELEHLGCNEEDILDVEKVIRAFADIHPSGGQASWLIPIIHQLLQFHPLTPLTDDPREWVKQDDDLWQNVRNSEAFSDNAGRTYWILSDRDRGIRYASAMVKHNRPLVDDGSSAVVPAEALVEDNG